jgi:hypothetical protein
LSLPQRLAISVWLRERKNYRATIHDLPNEDQATTIVRCVFAITSPKRRTPERIPQFGNGSS